MDKLYLYIYTLRRSIPFKQAKNRGSKEELTVINSLALITILTKAAQGIVNR